MAEKLTSLGEAIVETNEDVKLDKNIKNILSYKPILSRIFKETVIECEDMTYKEIEACIEGDALIDVVGLYPGTSNGVKIEGRTQEDSVYNEGMVTFDIRTVIRIPNQSLPVGVKLLVDIEAQKDDTPGYDISERAIFYCSRMISAQLNTEISNATADNIKYGNLKKVYSIWICTETAQKRANTIERYNIQRYVYPKEKLAVVPRYDLMEAVIVNISKEHNTEGTQSELIKMLTDLFNEKISSGEKIKLLEEEYDVPTTEEFSEEVANMTAYAAGLINKGKAEGMVLGEVKTLYLRVKMTPSEIAEEMRLSLEEVEAMISVITEDN